MNFDRRTQGIAERLGEQDNRQGFRLTRILDPMFWLAYLFSYFMLTPKYKLNKVEIAFILDNIDKHRKVLWINILGGCMVFISLSDNSPQQLSALISVLMAPAFITGGAWFAITFGGVPQKLLDAALVITLWMFAAFTLSLTTMSIVAYYILDGELLMLIVLLFINFAVMMSAILYDNIDGLKVGLDEALKDNSQATLRYLYKFHNIKPPREGEKLYHDISENKEK